MFPLRLGPTQSTNEGLLSGLDFVPVNKDVCVFSNLLFVGILPMKELDKLSSYMVMKLLMFLHTRTYDDILRLGS